MYVCIEFVCAPAVHSDKIKYKINTKQTKKLVTERIMNNNLPVVAPKIFQI